MSDKQEKVVLFAFRGDPMCFVHVMLNALDLDRRGAEVRVVLEGEAVTLVRSMQESGNRMFREMQEKGLIDGVCKACSNKMGVLEYNRGSGLRLLDALQGHPAMGDYLEQGFRLLVL